MVFVQVGLLVLACVIQHAVVLVADRLLHWNLMRSQLASAMVGLIFSGGVAAVLGKDSLWIPVGFTVFWTWQLFIVSLFKKSLSLRVLIYLGEEPELPFEEALKKEMLTEFRTRAEMLRSAGYAQRANECYLRGDRANSLSATIDNVAMRLFDVKLGNLF